MTWQDTLNGFRLTATTVHWNLPRDRVADDLESILGAPDSVDQGRFGFCGIATFLRFWIRRDPAAFARFATGLYDAGAAAIGGWQVRPQDALCKRDYLADLAAGDTRCTPGEWMVMAAIQDAISPAGFDGTVDTSWTAFLDLHEGAQPSQIADLLKHSGCYAKVDDQVPWASLLVPHESWLPDVGRPSLQDAARLQPGPDSDVVLLINDACIQGSAPVPAGLVGLLQADFPNHFVALETPLAADGGRVRGRIWTWAAFQELDLDHGAFMQNYYGAVVARR